LTVADSPIPEELGVLILSDCIATANERAEKRLQQLLWLGGRSSGANHGMFEYP